MVCYILKCKCNLTINSAYNEISALIGEKNHYYMLRKGFYILKAIESGLNVILNKKDQNWKIPRFTEAFKRADINLKRAKDEGVFDFLYAVFTDPDLRMLAHELHINELTMPVTEWDKLFLKENKESTEGSAAALYDRCNCELHL
jgi:hypothetical protein